MFFNFEFEIDEVGYMCILVSLEGCVVVSGKGLKKLGQCYGVVVVVVVFVVGIGVWIMLNLSGEFVFVQVVE